MALPYFHPNPRVRKDSLLIGIPLLGLLCFAGLADAFPSAGPPQLHGPLYHARPASEARIPLPSPAGVGADALYELQRQQPAPQESLLPAAAPSGCFDAERITHLPFELERFDEPHLLHFLELYCDSARRRAAGWLARAGRYRAHIESRTQALDAPPELLWVVAIESGFDPTARSPVGALGLWQFMRRTGQSRGLRIDRWVDERRCPERSTDEAIGYLLEHRERFGNWLIALAAYNAGYGHVRGQLRASNLTDFWQLHRYGAVHAGARAYALRVAALATIAANPEAFDMQGIVPDDPLRWVHVEVASATRLTLIATAAETTVETLRTLNPELLQPQTPPGPEPWSLRIPPDALDPFVRNWDRVRQRFGEEHEHVPLRFGESIDALASRLGIPERVLRQINQLSHGETVAAGTELIVPLRGRSTPTHTGRDETPVVLLPSQRFHYPDRHRIFFAAQTGDNVWTIAEHFGVMAEEVAMWNDLDTAAPLWEGMFLQLWTADLPDPAETLYLHEDDVRAMRLGSPEHESWLAERARQHTVRRRTHEVRSGDTVLGIAIRYGVRANDIIRWNNLSEDGRIVIGQQLRVRP